MSGDRPRMEAVAERQTNMSGGGLQPESRIEPNAAALWCNLIAPAPD
jgi:hypothetical protein